MKVLYVDQTGKLGGGELAILPWIVHARESAAVVLLEDGPFRLLLEAAGVPVEVMALGQVKAVRRESGFGAILGTLPAFWKLRNRLRARAADFDVLYANSQKAFLLCALAKQREQPLVWHLRDIMTAEHFSSVLRRLAVWFGNRYATRVVVNSHATGDSFVKAGGKPDKIRVVHDGVDAGPFDRLSPAEIAAARDALGVPAGAILVGLFGRISHWKGQHVLLEALRELPGIHAVLVGDALFGEDAYAERVRTLAAAPELAGRVHLPGFRRDIPALMKAMDIVVHTSIAPEPFGLVIVEGMLAGKPVIATAAGGALEIVHGNAAPEGDASRREEAAALLTSPGSVAELVVSIRALLDDPEAAGRLGERGRRRAEQHFSLVLLFERITDVLNEIEADSGHDT